MAEPGTGTDRGETMRLLREEVGNLVKTIPGPVSSIALRTGDCALEVSWDTRPQEVVPVAGGPVADAVGPVAEPEAGVVVTAPLVGTFYLAPEPGAAPFAAVGGLVEAGAPIGIVEAMKLMNPVPSPVSGEVLEVLVGDGEPVEFGQPLVRVRGAES